MPPPEDIKGRIAVGAAALAVEFSPRGKRAYAAASGAVMSGGHRHRRKQIVARARTGAQPWLARITPDGRTVLVASREDSALELFDAQTLAPLGTVGVAHHPEQIVVLPDSSMAFVSAADAKEISAVDLRRHVLLANLQLGSAPSRMILKPDGGELYVTEPDSHSLAIINTWTAGCGRFDGGRFAPKSVYNAAADQLYLSDSVAGRLLRSPWGCSRLGSAIPVGRQPAACRLDPSGELLLVANQESNDVAVIRVRTGSLLTMVPVGSRPSDIAIMLF